MGLQINPVTGKLDVVAGSASDVTNWNTAYTHSQDNTQAHSDYMLNTGDTGTGDYILDGAVTINESGADKDFRIEGVGEANALFVQGSDGFVGLGMNAPLYNLDVPEIGNSAGDFKIQPDVQSNVVLFGDIDVADDADGKSFYIYRKAAELDSFLRFYTDQYNQSYLYSSNRIYLKSGGDIWIQGNPIYFIDSTIIGQPWGKQNLNLKHYGYITAVTSQKYIQWKVNDATDNFELTREDSNIGNFDIQMPLITDDITTSGDISFADNGKLKLGTGADSEIYYDGTDLILDPDVVGTGKVLIGATGDDDMLLSTIEIDGALNHDGSNVGFYGTAPVAQQTGVAVTSAGIHTALVNLGLITA